MWCCLEMVGPEGRSSNAIKGFNSVEEAVSLFEYLSV